MPRTKKVTNPKQKTVRKVRKATKSVEGNVETKPKSDIHLYVALNGSKMETTGMDVLSLLRELIPPTSIKTKMAVRVQKDGGKEFTKVFSVFQARRIFANKTTMALLASDLTKLLNG